MVDVLIVAEDRLWVDTISIHLDQQVDLHVVGRVTGLSQTLEHIPFCDLIVIHHEASVPSSLARVRQILDQGSSDAKVVIVGVPNNPAVILEYLEAGVIGYVRVDDPLDRLLLLIKAIPIGQTMIDPDIAAAMVNRLAELRHLVDDIMPNAPEVVDLTPREVEVLSNIAQGKSNQEIADGLFISVGTVKNHVHNILDKLNVHDRNQAAAIVNREKLGVDQ